MLQRDLIDREQGLPASAEGRERLELRKRVLLVSSWAPPALGGPQNLYNIFSRIDSRHYAMLTSIVNEPHPGAHAGSRLPCRYYFYDEEKGDQPSFTRPETSSLIKALRRIRRGIMLPRRIVRSILIGLRVMKEERVGLLLACPMEGSP